jgi:hypothetical protein
MTERKASAKANTVVLLYAQDDECIGDAIESNCNCRFLRNDRKKSKNKSQYRGLSTTPSASSGFGRDDSGLSGHERATAKAKADSYGMTN